MAKIRNSQRGAGTGDALAGVICLIAILVIMVFGAATQTSFFDRLSCHNAVTVPYPDIPGMKHYQSANYLGVRCDDGTWRGPDGKRIPNPMPTP